MCARDAAHKTERLKPHTCDQIRVRRAAREAEFVLPGGRTGLHTRVIRDTSPVHGDTYYASPNFGIRVGTDHGGTPFAAFSAPPQFRMSVCGVVRLIGLPLSMHCCIASALPLVLASPTGDTAPSLICR